MENTSGSGNASVPENADGGHRKEALRAYQSRLAESQKYSGNRQESLKARVFDTFHNLLVHRGMDGLKHGLRLADLGSADGAFVKVCCQKGLDAVGIDAADGIDFETDRLPFHDASFDIVTAISIIEHLRYANVMLKEALRILKPGGAMILVTPNWKYSWRDFYNDPTHFHPYTPGSLGKELANHGFVETYVVPWIVKKPVWMWDMPNAFFAARWLIPFRGDAPSFIPEILRGKSGTILAMARKPTNPD